MSVSPRNPPPLVVLIRAVQSIRCQLQDVEAVLSELLLAEGGPQESLLAQLPLSDPDKMATRRLESGA